MTSGRSSSELCDLLQSAKTRIREHLLCSTPLLCGSNSEAQNILFKAEILLPTGSFKVRAALNGILSQLEHCQSRGVVTSSSGNFAQAVAWSAARLNCSSCIVMTSSTSEYKINRTRDLGAEVILCGPTFEERWETTYRILKETGRVLLHPYDSLETILGNGTIGLELDEQLACLSAETVNILVPVSGGGLLAGIATALKTLPNPNHKYRIIGVQQQVNASLKRSMEEGAPVKVAPFSSIADALVALTPGKLAFGLIQQFVDEVVLVAEPEILNSAKFLLQEQKLLVEPAGAISLAAIRSGRYKPKSGELSVCLLSGGNIPAQQLF